MGIVSDPGIPRPPFRFCPEDEAFLDQVQRGAVNWMRASAHPVTGFVPDRSGISVASVAGVGFELPAICAGIERGWITPAEGREWSLRILRALRADPRVRHAGLYQHFIDLASAGPHTQSNLEHTVSTIDSALLLCGVIVAGEYFGGEHQRLARAIVDDADWSAFVSPGDEGFGRGTISLGWQCEPGAGTSESGKLIAYSWLDSGCEHRLVTFLAVAAPRADHAIDPLMYYRLRRGLGDEPGVGPMVWFPYSGALFVNQFSHVFLDYAAMGPDDPARVGVRHRVGVDWWENSRRHTLLHRSRAIQNPRSLPTLGPDAWGLSASDSPAGYLVAGVFPRRVVPEGYVAGEDYSEYLPSAENWGDGTIAPYAAGMSILFEPTLALRALRHYHALALRPGLEKLWDDPAQGGFGFADAYNERGPDGRPWVAPEHLAIDQLPMMLAIENARSGLIWRLFHQSEVVRQGLDRLALPQPGRTSE